MDAKQPEPLLLTYKQAAARIGISLRWLYVLMKNGEIHSLDLGGQVRRISAAECETYVKRLEVEQIGKAS